MPARVPVIDFLVYDSGVPIRCPDKRVSTGTERRESRTPRHRSQSSVRNQLLQIHRSGRDHPDIPRLQDTVPSVETLQRLHYHRSPINNGCSYGQASLCLHTRSRAHRRLHQGSGNDRRPTDAGQHRRRTTFGVESGRNSGLYLESQQPRANTGIKCLPGLPRRFAQLGSTADRASRWRLCAVQS